MIQVPAGLAYLRTFPDFERGNVAATEAFGLRRILALLEELGSPHLDLPILHLAGTKGKGSTAAMLASIVSHAGYRTGLFTQPHLIHVHERFTVNGVRITDPEIDEILLRRIRPAVERLDSRGIGGVQQFEAQVALALLWFQTRGVDVVVLETGLGGRLDGTNVAPQPLATILTPIGYDHMQILGNTLRAIAGEKAAIIKPTVPVVCTPQSPEAQRVIEEAAVAAAAPMLLGGRDWHSDDAVTGLEGTRFSLTVSVRALRHAGGDSAALPHASSAEQLSFPDLVTPLLGVHQAVNGGAAAVAALVAAGRFPRIDNPSIRAGLAAVSWPGRMQVLDGAPPVVLDGAHTGESAAALAAALRDVFPGRGYVLICGIPADKDIAAFAAPLASLARCTIATRSAHPRAAAPDVVAAAFRAAGCPFVEIAGDPIAALDRARTIATAGDVIVATGSLHVVGALLAALRPS